MPDEKESFKDLFSAHADRYAKARPTYPRELFLWLASISPSRGLAWDCATGNGQAAMGLAEPFERVIATDASEEQLKHATPHARITYRVATCEEADLPDQSADLVTIAQALHWLRFEDFYANVRRILRPGGILAAWCYAENHITTEVDAITRRLDKDIVGAYWPEGRHWIDEHFQSIPFPPGELHDLPVFTCRVEWTLAEYVAYLDTWSSVQRYRAMKGCDPLESIAADLAAVWGLKELRRSVSWPLHMRIARMQ